MKTAVVSPERVEVNRAELGQPPARLYELYRRQFADPVPYAGAEKRCEPRHAVALRVVAVPANSHGEACGAPFVCLSANISASGLGLLHTAAVSEAWLDVELDEPGGGKRHGLLEVLRCRPVGQCFEIAGRFVQRS